MKLYIRLIVAKNSTRRFRLSICALAAATALAACGGGTGGDSGSGGNKTAQTIYKNGDILTVDKQDSVAQAVGVRDGKIIAVGTVEEVEEYKGPNTKIVDLAGKAMIPGIYDAHSHFTYTGTNAHLETDLNSPPIGTVDNIDDIVALLQQKNAELGTDPGTWISGFGYDDTLLAENRHLNRHDLDRVSTTQPVYITHISGHMSVANTKALELAGVTAATDDPDGGVIGRETGGKTPSGFLAENAMGLISSFKPGMTAEDVQEGIHKATYLYASKGVTTANDGASSAGGIAALEKAAQDGKLSIRVMAWPTSLKGVEDAEKLDLPSGKVKIGGIKNFYDGSIQGYTGYLSEPYHVHPGGDEPADYAGYPRTSDKAGFEESVLKTHKAGRQLFIHANGDQAVEDVIQAYKKAQDAFPREDARHVVIHSQMAREDQLDLMKTLGVIPSFFELHTYYWGDRHRDIFMGPERAANMSPLGSAKARNMIYTIHADTPIVPMDPMLMIWAAVNRVSTSGKVIGPGQTVTPMDALRATTYNAAYSNFEEGERGSIEVGKYADLVVLSANPAKGDPMAIKDIEVLETILEGATVFQQGN